MAEEQNGQWVTINGKHIFLSNEYSNIMNEIGKVKLSHYKTFTDAGRKALMAGGKVLERFTKICEEGRSDEGGGVKGKINLHALVEATVGVWEDIGYLPTSAEAKRMDWAWGSGDYYSQAKDKDPLFKHRGWTFKPSARIIDIKNGHWGVTPEEKKKTRPLPKQ